MKILNVIFLLSLFVQSCSGQTKTPKREIFNSDFNWTITIPENFEKLSSAEWKKLQNKGTKAIEKNNDIDIENQSKNLFIFRSDQLNYIESNYQPFDTTINGKYIDSFNAVNSMLFKTFMTQFPNIRIDTSTTIEIIDNLSFYTYKMKIHYQNNLKWNVLMFRRLFDNRDFTVNIMYTDEKKGELMLKAWRASKFK